MLFGSHSLFYKFCLHINFLNLSEKILRRKDSFKHFQPLNISSQRKFAHIAYSKIIETIGGKGGDGKVSFLQSWCGERAGPDGGDGGNGGHVIFKSSVDVHSLNHVSVTVKAADGENGGSYGCNGANGKNTIVKVPLGTIIRHGSKIVCYCDKEHTMFVSARGGSGGKGNKFFGNTKNSAPKICEYGNYGEKIIYNLEVRRAADIGLIGCPEVGKSTLFNIITRAKSELSSHEFIIRPHIGLVHYDDYAQFAIADLPGLVRNSYRNESWRLQFLRCIDQCELFMFVLDISLDSPWNQYFGLMNELTQLNSRLVNRPKIIIGNKVDKLKSRDKLDELERQISHPVIPISAQKRINISYLLIKMRENLEEIGKIGNKI